jgi:short-subunit dehydrogenase
MLPSESRKTALITGSTHGIGRSLAQQYLAAGWKVITHGRSSAPFPDTATEHISLDLSTATAGQELLAALTTMGVQQLDLLINNAALAHYGPLADQTPENIRELVTLNLHSPLSLTWHLLPMLRATGGKIVYISSVAAALPTPLYAVYSATKAALDGFVRSFRQEIKETGVSVQIVHPAGTTTEMHHRAGFPPEKLARMKFSTADTVAGQIIRKITRQTNGPLTFGMQAATLLCRKLPHLVDRLVARSQKALWNGTQPQAGQTLITGSHSGIGAALYQQASQPVGIDLAGNPTLRADLADFSQITALQPQIATLPHVTLAIWNAGINATGRFWEIPWSKHQQLLNLNFLAPLLLSRSLLRSHPTATQVFISSLSHHLSYPGASSYAATKDGIAHYARSLRCLGLHAQTVFPGPTDTPHAALHSPPGDPAKSKARMPAAQLAEKILAATKTHAPTLIPGPANKVFALLGHWCPASMEWAMRKLLWAKMPPGHTTG